VTSFGAVFLHIERKRNMLCLSRKIGEQIMVGDDIVITVISIQPDKVKLGITANGDVPVWRREIYDKIKDSGMTAREHKQAKEGND